MPYKTVRPPCSNPGYLAILVPEVISPGRAISNVRQNSAILVPDAINPGRAISYAMQNRVPTYQLPCVPSDTDS